jgi:redox-sensitive bicupin YhaK (pirin superfamily)
MFGNTEVPLLDPFLLLDNFGSADPEDYLAGFPWHPHRGLETVTYMLNGRTAHEDSLGNKGVIGTGDVQWMSAGSGILHQEMPKRTEGRLSGFQLWVNLPRDRKMETPAYRGVDASTIPEVRGDDGRTIKVVAGSYESVEGPVKHIPVDPFYFDVVLPAEAEFRHPVHRGHTLFAQVVDGSGSFDRAGVRGVGDEAEDGPGDARDGVRSPTVFTPGHTLLYADGDAVRIRAGRDGVRFLLVSGRPLREPVAWYGPIVMNTRDEIVEAVSDLRKGSFVRTTEILNEM